MADNLLLYNGPSQTEGGTNIVTMNESEDQLRFDIWYNSDKETAHHALVLKCQIDRLTLAHFPDLNRAPHQKIRHEPFNIFTELSNHILDSSAHKVYRKAIFRALRKYVTVDSFKTLVDPETALTHAMFPVLQQVPVNSYRTLRTIQNSRYREYIRSIRQPTVQKMTLVLFGKKRYRKDLVKALAGANSLEFLAFMFSLKREMPVDWFINILRNNPTLSSLPDEFNYSNLKRFYDSLSDKQFRKFCKCLMEEEFVPIQSILDMAEQFRECLADPHNELDPVTNIKFRSIEEFHYMVGKYHENTTKERERRELIKKHGGELKGNKWYDRLKDISFDGAPYEVVIPKYAFEIVQWGQEMSNCIGGYASRAKDSETDVYVALKDKEGANPMKANILLSSRNIRQFFAKRNSQVDRGIAFDFNMRLVLGGIIESSDHLFGTHYNDLIIAVGVNSLEDIINDYKAVGSTVDDYIRMRNIYVTG